MTTMMVMMLCACVCESLCHHIGLDTGARAPPPDLRPRRAPRDEPGSRRCRRRLRAGRRRGVARGVVGRGTAHGSARTRTSCVRLGLCIGDSSSCSMKPPACLPRKTAKPCRSAPRKSVGLRSFVHSRSLKLVETRPSSGEPRRIRPKLLRHCSHPAQTCAKLSTFDQSQPNIGRGQPYNGEELSVRFGVRVVCVCVCDRRPALVELHGTAGNVGGHVAGSSGKLGLLCPPSWPCHRCAFESRLYT